MGFTYRGDETSGQKHTDQQKKRFHISNIDRASVIVELKPILSWQGKYTMLITKWNGVRLFFLSVHIQTAGFWFRNYQKIHKRLKKITLFDLAIRDKVHIFEECPLYVKIWTWQKQKKKWFGHVHSFTKRTFLENLHLVL